MSNSVSAANVSGSVRDQASVTSLRFSDTVVAYTILRVSFGANIMLHGVSRLLAGHAAFLAYLTHYFEKTSVIPASVLPAFASVLPWVETTLGLLLLLGLATRFSLIVGALVITSLVIGTNLAQDWLVSGLQLIYAFLYYYLLVHLNQNQLSVGGFLKS
jgi:thiosulfate dehydrogenase (quinone) large subunit